MFEDIERVQELRIEVDSTIQTYLNQLSSVTKGTVSLDDVAKNNPLHGYQAPPRKRGKDKFPSDVISALFDEQKEVARLNVIKDEITGMNEGEKALNKEEASIGSSQEEKVRDEVTNYWSSLASDSKPPKESKTTTSKYLRWDIGKETTKAATAAVYSTIKTERNGQKSKNSLLGIKFPGKPVDSQPTNGKTEEKAHVNEPHLARWSEDLTDLDKAASQSPVVSHKVINFWAEADTPAPVVNNWTVSPVSEAAGEMQGTADTWTQMAETGDTDVELTDEETSGETFPTHIDPRVQQPASEYDNDFVKAFNKASEEKKSPASDSLEQEKGKTSKLKSDNFKENKQFYGKLTQKLLDEKIISKRLLKALHSEWERKGRKTPVTKQKDSTDNGL